MGMGMGMHPGMPGDHSLSFAMQAKQQQLIAQQLNAFGMMHPRNAMSEQQMEQFQQFQFQQMQMNQRYMHEMMRLQQQQMMRLQQRQMMGYGADPREEMIQEARSLGSKEAAVEAMVQDNAEKTATASKAEEAQGNDDLPLGSEAHGALGSALVCHAVSNGVNDGQDAHNAHGDGHDEDVVGGGDNALRAGTAKPMEVVVVVAAVDTAVVAEDVAGLGA